MNPRASVDIDAPIEKVWAVMLDTEAYGEWNPFVVRADCATPPKVGDPITLHVRWASGGGTTSPERITGIEPPHDEEGVRRALLAYVFEGWPAKLRLVRGTRYQRLSQAPGGPTRYETVEEFSGPLVPLAGPKRVEDGFRRHAEALRKRCEAV
jgi:hypothetical protein